MNGFDDGKFIRRVSSRKTESLSYQLYFCVGTNTTAVPKWRQRPAITESIFTMMSGRMGKVLLMPPVFLSAARFSSPPVHRN